MGATSSKHDGPYPGLKLYPNRSKSFRPSAFPGYAPNVPYPYGSRLTNYYPPHQGSAAQPVIVGGAPAQHSRHGSATVAPAPASSNRTHHARSHSESTSTHRRYSERVPVPRSPQDISGQIPSAHTSHVSSFPGPAPPAASHVEPILNPPPRHMSAAEADARLFHSVLEPLPQANPAAYGPGGPRPRTPLNNPLPPPPRDIYELTPYRNLLRDLPVSDLLMQPAQMSSVIIAPEPETRTGFFGRNKARRSRGLLRAFSYSHSQVPPNVTRAEMPGSIGAALLDAARARPDPLHQPQPPFSSQPSASATAGHSAERAPSTTYVPPAGPTVPVSSESQQPVRFDHQGPLAGFMNHSPHPVVYQDKTYPTALHLHEALKFLHHRPDLSERIRAGPQVQEVYPLSASFQKHVRPDWGGVFLAEMDEVLYHKFNQHPSLRSLLLDTGFADIIYAEPNDPFWGEGTQSQGTNHLGRALMRVRDRLRQERH